MTEAASARLIYREDQLPIFQNYLYETEAEAKSCPKGDIYRVENQKTGLVYTLAFRAELMTYDSNYQNELAISPLLKKHLELVSGIVKRCMSRDSIVEIGCGKRFFLETLLAKGFDVTGFYPTYEGGENTELLL